jgi:hypothetical protein
MEKPTVEHLVAVKRILCYVAGTMHLGCHYQKEARKADLLGYSDSDHGADVDMVAGVLVVFCSSSAKV